MGPPDSLRITRVRRYSGYPLSMSSFRVRGSHPLRRTFPDASASLPWSLMWVLQPRLSFLKRFGLFRVRSPLLTESRLISFPAGTEMVQFPALALLSEYQPMTAGGFPHSDIPGSSRACPLPEAFRRLLRPSSPPAAKASTMCPL